MILVVGAANRRNCCNWFDSFRSNGRLSVLILQLFIATPVLSNHLLTTVEERGNIIILRKNRNRVGAKSDSNNNNTNDHDRSNNFRYKEVCSSANEFGYSKCLLNTNREKVPNEPKQILEQTQKQERKEYTEDDDGTKKNAVANDGKSCVRNGGGGGDDDNSSNGESGNDNENNNNTPCIDKNSNCKEWAYNGECDKNVVYMRNICKKSCFHCVDNRHHIHDRSLLEDERWNLHQQTLSLNVYEKSRVIERLFQTQTYMLNEVYHPQNNDKYSRDVRINCKNRDKKCSLWAAVGECDRNPAFMKLKCAPACLTCDQLDMNNRCPFDDGEPKLWSQPNGLNKMFQNILSDPYYEQQYGPIILHSRPKNYKNMDNMGNMDNMDNMDDSDDNNTPCYHDENNNKNDIIQATDQQRPHQPQQPQQQPQQQQQQQPQQQPQPQPQQPQQQLRPIDGPWILTIENFLSTEECDKLIQVGTDKGYEKSFDFGKKLYDGTHDRLYNKGRTSTNTWLDDKEIMKNDVIVRNILLKMENLTGIHDNYTEHIQLLRYEETQRYTPHHDFIPAQTLLQMGPRIFTLYIYLNDVELGGGTNFPKLGITVLPKKGKVLLWPSVTNEDPDSPDRRTTHQALPVEKGLKYGANAWYHPRDYKTVYDKGCSG